MGPLLNESSSIVTNVVFAELKIIGDLKVENSLNGTTWSALDDLVSREDEIVEITGHKAFLSEVEVGSELIITNQRINGHALEDFVTLDTDQTLPSEKCQKESLQFPRERGKRDCRFRSSVIVSSRMMIHFAPLCPISRPLSIYSIDFQIWKE